MKLKRWTKEEIKLMHKHYPNCINEELLKIFPDRKIGSIKHKAKNLLLVRTKETRSIIKSSWTGEETKILVENYPVCTKAELLKLLPNRNANSIKTKAGKLKLVKTDETLIRIKYTYNQNWDDASTSILIELYPTHTANEIAKILGKTRSMVKNRVNKLKLEPKENTGCYKKGDISANKFKKMKPEVYKKCKATMFKKGNKPHNTRTDGALSLRKNYIYTRVKEGVWVQLQRVIWEKYNGKIPEKHNIIFKDKDLLNFEIENLECISNTELMRRNTIHKYPDEVKQLIRLNQKLKNQIKKQIKKYEL